MQLFKKIIHLLLSSVGLPSPYEEEKSKEENLKEGLEIWTAAIERSPKVAHYYRKRSHVHQHLNNYTDAIEDISQAIQHSKDPRERASNYLTRGLLYAKKSQIAEAENDFYEAMKLDGNLKIEGHRGLAYAFEGVKTFDKAVEHYNVAIASCPSATDKAFLKSLYEGRMRVHLRCRNHSDALYDLDKLWQLDRNDTKVLIQRASLKVRLDQIDAALSDINAALQIEPKNLRALEFRAFLPILKDDFATAEQMCAEVLRDYPNSWQSHDTRGYIHFIRHEYDTALRHFQNVIDAAGENLSGVYQGKVGQSLTLYAQGQKDEAMVVWHELSAKSSAFQSIETLRDYYILPQQALDIAQQLISDAEEQRNAPIHP